MVGGHRADVGAEPVHRAGQRLRIGGLVLEPISDMPGVTTLPLRNRFTGRRAHEPVEIRGQPRPVDRRSVGFFDSPDGAALNKQPFDRIERRQVVMAPGSAWYLRLSDPHSVANRGTSDRVHFVIDCIANDWLIGQLRAATAEGSEQLQQQQ